MTRLRDRLIAAMAALLVLAVAGLVVLSVRAAERNGRDALEDLQTAQVEQLARSMDKRIEGITGITAGLRLTPFTLAPGDPTDAARLAPFVLDPNARTGVVLVNHDGEVVNGALLGPLEIGDTVDVAGLDDAMASTEATLLPVQQGLTTSELTVPVVFPLDGARGALLAETEVTADSAFNTEVAELGRGETGEFLFLDSTGTVLASSNPSLLGRPLAEAGEIMGHSGLARQGDRVVVTAPVTGIGWTAVFRQDSSEFEGGLTGPLQRAVLLLAVAAVIGGGIASAALLRRLRAAREEQRRLSQINAAREEFISIVSHELRTPVAGVLGFLETSIDHWEDMSDVDRRSAVGRAAANARRLQALTRDVLDTASIERGELTFSFARLDLQEAVADAVAGGRDAYPDRDFDLTPAPRPVWVRADADRVQQVLANLFDNAVKSSPPGTPVEVAVSVHDADAVITVTDRGVGMPDQALDQVFEKFVRGPGQTVRGTGLGLYICRQIVEAHGGHITAENMAERGARLTISIPLATP